MSENGDRPVFSSVKLYFDDRANLACVKEYLRECGRKREATTSSDSIRWALAFAASSVRSNAAKGGGK